MEAKIEFISLTDSVNAIADRVPEPESWKGIIPQLAANIPGNTASGSVEDFQSWIQANNDRDVMSLLVIAYRCSEAAAMLDQSICNSSTSGPRWFDLRHTGRPRQNAIVRDEAIDILLHMAGYFERFREGGRAGKFDIWPGSTIEFHEGQFKSNYTYQRSREIGFDRPELVRLLASSGIPHGFGELILGHSGAVGVTPTADWVSTSGSSVLGATGNPKPKQFRGELAHVIKTAWQNAGDPNDYQSVWAEFIKIAIYKASDYPTLDLSYVSNEDAIKWTNSEASIETFKKSDMRKRIDPNARGRR